MNYKFNVNLTDTDYIDLNMFINIRSYYAKEFQKKTRILYTALCLAIILITLISGGFSKEAFIGNISTIVILLVFQLLFNKFLALSLKSRIKVMKKTGKMPYSPDNVMEFYNDYFVKNTADEKNEVKYTAIERVSVIENKYIYIHVNCVQTYILPMRAFASTEQFYFFLAFLKTKYLTIDSYK